MPNRPTALLVMCILGICWASLGLIFGVLGMGMFFIDVGTPAQIAMKHEAWNLVLVFGIGSIGFLMNVLLLSGSIGGLRVKAWARGVLMMYGVGNILNNLAALVIDFA